MSVDVVPGGQRRIDRVLDPRFTDGVERLDLAELRSRREEAEAEEADVSYLRRLLQGRLEQAVLVQVEQCRDHPPDGRVVVDDEHAVQLHRGHLPSPARGREAQSDRLCTHRNRRGRT